MSINTVTVVIDLATTPATVAGFGTQLHVSTHKWFPERVRTYATLNDAADIPADSPEYAAISMHFAQQPVHPIKLGRRDTASTTITPEDVAEGVTYSLTVTVNDGATVTASYTAVALDTAVEVATALYDAIVDETDVTDHVNVVDNSGSITITEITANDFFYIPQSTTNLAYTWVASSEVPADTLDAVELEDPDYYGITYNETDDASVELMAAEAEGRKKLFLYCSSDQAILTAWNKTDAGVDILADLNLDSRRQTIGMYHDEAQITFPEVGVFAYFAGRGYQPGTVNWNWKTISGVGPARNTTDGNVLTTTQKNNITSRNANTFEREATGTIFAPGSVMRGTGDKLGEWIEHVTSANFLEARITEAYKTKFANQLKISYSSVGINSQKSTLATVLDRYVETETTPNILDIDKPYELNFPRSEDVSFAQKASQILPVGFTGYLSGTQSGVQVQGVLTFNADV